MAAIVVAAVVVAIAAAIVAGVLSIRSQLQGSVDELAQNRDRAERMVQERARRYAAAVTGTEPGVSDHHLDELALNHDVTVLVIGRESRRADDIRLVIQVVEPYGSRFTTGVEVLACYQIVLTGLGTPDAAHRLTKVSICPVASRVPVEETSG